MVIMVIIDAVSKQFLQSKKVFADIFNYVLYDGKPVIKEELLSVVSEGLTLIEEDSKRVVSRNRDVKMSLIGMEDPKNVYMLLGIESQANVDYTMPLRNALYDLLDYDQQVRQRKRSRRGKKREKSSQGGEYLSRYHKEDRLRPVITVVMYFGSEEWDGPMSLGEMLDVEDEGILEHTVNYKLTLIAPMQMRDEEIEKFETNVREVLKYIKCSKDKEALIKLVKEDERYKDLEIEAARLLNVVTNSKFKLDERKERVDMCKAIDDLREESVALGEARGREEEREEAREKLRQMSHNLFSFGMSISDIAKAMAEDESVIEGWIASFS